MKAELIPKVRIEVRPMVVAMVHTMGIENSPLAEVILDSFEKEISKVILEIPEMVKKELRDLTSELIRNEFETWISCKYGKDVRIKSWVSKNEDG